MNNEVRSWLEYLKQVCSLSDATIRSYQNDVAAWYTFLDSRKTDYKNAVRNDARAFVSSMSGSHMSPSTINRRLSALRNYYEWLKRNNKTGSRENPFSESKSVKKSRKLPGFLSYGEIEKFLDSAGTDFTGRRDRFLFELLYSTGCRVSEICSLNVTDLSENQIRIKGKGGKERIVFAGKSAMEAYKAYIPFRNEKAADDSDSKAALFLDLRGKRLTSRGVYYLVRKYSAKTGTVKKVSPHTFRHSFATHILDEGADIRVVQEMLGHSSLSTTQIYTHTGIERIKRVYRSSHPHAKGQTQTGGKNV